MNRPYVICHILTSLDGKISGKFFSAKETGPAREEYAKLREFYDCPATMYGTTTMAEGFSEGLLFDVPENLLNNPRADWVAESDVSNYIVSVDPYGTLAFSGKYLERKGRPKSHIIEVLTDEVSDDYINYLRNLGISYIFAGKNKLDCELMLQKLKELFGIEKVMLAGGGIMNWSMASANLIDELSLVLAPTTDGDSTTPSLFEAGDVSETVPTAFSLKEVSPLDGDALWLRYASKNPIE